MYQLHKVLNQLVRDKIRRQELLDKLHSLHNQVHKVLELDRLRKA